ncbi:putative Alpha-ribazole phosphatase (anaerobic pathway of cobalamin biosynthesis, cobC) [Bradyrhizobium sp. ORS 375]|uniref:histidine phosphatase family protein n=1 Tax=Bradyrhizobium sp. (strain ORS 375) TaxID=566679 RepID=UPI000240A19A|nr:histidine phosphatase family protein [Bradyrhizobium sp. ORS 375]CCD92856.1 putative Alpha-ribazole phosphatase (anaerobic pathway of cobalamin biosynthesis, cobC) [Bradyrhizobium sp. ORS 375]
MRLDLLRHGTTGRDGYLDGRTDPPLSEAGWEQFRRQTQSRAWRTVVSSPLARARAAAECYALQVGIAPEIDEDWSELHFGQWDGRKRSDIVSEPKEAALLEAFYADPAVAAPEGESWANLQVRVSRAMDRILATPEPAPVLVVTHGGAIRAALAHLLGWPLHRLWSLRIHPGTRLTLEAGQGADGAPWGEIVEIIQP